MNISQLFHNINIGGIASLFIFFAKGKRKLFKKNYTKLPESELITGECDEEKIIELIRENFDLRPAGIIKMLDLRRPIYKQTAAYGHFGRTDIDLPWERLDKVEDLKKSL